MRQRLAVRPLAGVLATAFAHAGIASWWAAERSIEALRRIQHISLLEEPCEANCRRRRAATHVVGDPWRFCWRKPQD